MVGPLLDIILSLIVRGVIVLAVLNTTIALQSKLSEKTMQANMFNLTTTVARIMTTDFNMVGYSPSPPLPSSPYFTSATQDTIEITYYNPTYSNQRWVKYFLGNRSEMSSTSNPNDHRLYRADGTSPGSATPVVVASGVDSLKFKYFDGSGTPTSTKSSIKSFQVYLLMATGEKVNGIYPAGEWTYRFYPMNLY